MRHRALQDGVALQVTLDVDSQVPIRATSSKQASRNATSRPLDGSSSKLEGTTLALQGH